MHLGKTLSESLTIMRTDFLFWPREVYEKIMLQSLPSGKGSFLPGKGKFDRPFRPPPLASDGAYGPKGGKKGGKASGKGKKGKGGKSTKGAKLDWLPQGLKGRQTTKSGERVCYSFNLQTCQTTGAKCEKGVHVCCFCNEGHPYLQCPKRN